MINKTRFAEIQAAILQVIRDKDGGPLDLPEMRTRVLARDPTLLDRVNDAELYGIVVLASLDTRISEGLLGWLRVAGASYQIGFFADTSDGNVAHQASEHFVEYIDAMTPAEFREAWDDFKLQVKVDRLARSFVDPTLADPTLRHTTH